MTNSPVPLAYRGFGTVTELTLSLAGMQDVRIDVAQAGTDNTTMTLRWGPVAMLVSSAAVAHRLLALFATAREGWLHSAAHVPFPDKPATHAAMSTVSTIAWHRPPTGTVTRENVFVPELRRSVSIIELNIRPATFRIYDRAAGDSAVGMLTRAWKIAVEVFPDGPQWRSSPLRPSRLTPARPREHTPPSAA